MTATLQSQAIQIANGLLAIGAQLASYKVQIDQLSTQYSQLTLGTVLAALPTAASNTDGSIGTADGAPNAAHIINTGIITSLTRAISANDIGSLLTGLQAVSTLLGGSAVTQQGQMPQLLAKVTGG